jgi:hypothetical protein
MFFMTPTTHRVPHLPMALPQGAGDACAYVLPVIPAEAAYAHVRVGQRVIATITNSGHIRRTPVFGRRQPVASEESDWSVTGPALAERRAQQLARAYGGIVVVAPTALAPVEWESCPAVMWRIDCARLRRDGYGEAPDLRYAQFADRGAALHRVAQWLGLVA